MAKANEIVNCLGISAPVFKHLGNNIGKGKKEAVNFKEQLPDTERLCSEVGKLSSCGDKKSLSLKKSITRELKGSHKKTTKPTRMFKVEDGIVHELLELENGNLAMTGIKDSKIRIFDFISATLKKELEGHNDYVMEMRSIPSRNLLLSYS